MRGRRRVLLLVPLSVCPLLAFQSHAQVRSDCPGGLAPQGTVVAVDGTVTGRAEGGDAFDVSVGTVLCPLDEIRTGSRSRVEFRLAGRDTTTGSSSNAVTVIPAPDSDCVSLLGGIIALISSVEGSYCVRTPFIDAGIEGTEAVVAVDAATGDSFVLVRTGLVSVVDRRDPADRLLLDAGVTDRRAAAFATVMQHLTPASPDNVPAKFRDLLLNPEGATDWAIYYPPVLLGTGIADPTVREAAALLDAGDPEGAEALLAGARLEGDAIAAALSLRAVAAISRNENAAGTALADEAVALAPELGAAHIARSYALQAEGRLDAALEEAEAAVAVAPGDAYAWARLAELHLTVGAYRPARRAVDRSLAIAETALGRTVEGFTTLAADELDGAEAAFGRAIAIDSEAPLPRLGLGLAAIRQGRVEEGRLEIETAVALDPRRASLRTWLGRAYLEDEQTEEAATQFALAQEYDPDDPTAYLFSAMARFQANDPIGALGEIRAAEERGEGRAAIRSEIGLGEDAAIRSVAAGRVFDVLGFEELAVQKAAEAVDIAPTSPDAHRFLFDAYRGRPGFEIAQTSELLRYQLLLPPSNEPVQPSLSQADLALLTVPGVTRPTFHEFAPLFKRDGLFGFVSGTVGNNGTFGDEVAFSVLDGSTSLSVGQYHFQTHGFRFNDDVAHDVVSLLAKHAPVPELTITTEARVRSTSEGNRFLRSFDDPFTGRIDSDLDSALFRLGAHARPAEDLDVLAVGTVSRVETDVGEFFPSSFLDNLTETSTDALNLELQGIYQFGFGHVTAGTSLSRNRGDGTTAFGLLPLDLASDQAALYAYATLRPLESLQLTLGLGYEQAEADEILLDPFTGDTLPLVDDDLSQLSPKLGIRWEVLDDVVLRAALIRTLKRDFVSDQTLEPTTVAGFPQFFDDFDRTDAWTAGIGLDIALADNLWIGAEYLYRSLEIPALLQDPTSLEFVDAKLDGEEQRVTAYANATVASRWALSAGIEYIDNTTDALNRPDEVRTLLTPIGAFYFHPSGLFAGAEAIWFDQSAQGEVGSVFQSASVDTDESGVVLNAALGYRLPANRGLVALEVHNLLDHDLSLQNSLNNSARPSTRPLAEELSVFARAIFSF